LAEPSSDTTVVIIGAGPAGLVLANILRAAGVDCLVLERQSREHVERRARAGFLAANSVRILTDHGLAAGLLRHGQQHDTCLFRTGDAEFELKYSGLGRGEIHTVYPQQNLVTDLIAEYLARGGEIRFSTTVSAVGGAGTDRPWVRTRDADGAPHRWRARYVAGCDGQHGVSRQAVPPGAARRYRRDHGASWLAILVEAGPSMAAVGYAVHPEGFAGHMARSASVTRYYLQCPPGDDPGAWSDERIWAQLRLRLNADRYQPLRQGPVIERQIVDLSSHVMEPFQYGSLFLAGDAASLISPSAAKGANLAVMESEVLARALVAALTRGDPEPLARYSADCLPRIWRAQEFSYWMINLLNAPAGDGDEATFLRALQRARLEDLRHSRAAQDHFAENYVGI
jgi:p-hydroxybenzoate 3-monooxygenase